MSRCLLLFAFFLSLANLAGQATASPADQDHIISIFFGGGSYYIDAEQATRLKQFLDAIPNLEAYEIEVQAHTDDIGNRAYNLRLSEFRGAAVRERLIQYPVAPEAIQVLPLGEDAPVYNNATWEGKISNRRVDVILKRILF
ncbi:OmpA family protein [Neolewinella lacunae]|uniref:OmpA family protein n=1 Tax=Neolewinella lacunae TaxID=1517758 RepID=A0A923PQZ8_9BACT|nr:OmpA family protein [Neolewinella lacunae]MBC6995884.1 OmpA family protein [Neolewinella lacunae]MDN3636424.1 OmpA family protein [Neolewinella lacunae]